MVAKYIKKKLDQKTGETRISSYTNFKYLHHREKSKALTCKAKKCAYN